MLADDFVWSTAHPDGEVTEAGGDAFLTDAGGQYRPGADLQLWPIAIRDDRVMLANEFDGAAADPTRLTLLAIDDHDRLARVSQTPTRSTPR